MLSVATKITLCSTMIIKSLSILPTAYATDVDFEDAVDDGVKQNLTDKSSKNDTNSSNSTQTDESESKFEILSSYLLTHCIDDECWPRGTLQLGKNGARIDDNEKFNEMKDSNQLQAKLMAADQNAFYTLILHLAGTKGKGSNGKNKTLQTSIPVHLIKNTEDLHDSVEVSLAGPSSSKTSDSTSDSSEFQPNTEDDGFNVLGINYRFTKAWGLNLFEHTTVRLLRPNQAPSIRLPPRVVPKKPPVEPKFNADGTLAPPPREEGPNSDEPQGIMGLFRKYWWAFLLGMLILQFMSTDVEQEPPRRVAAGGSQGSQGGGSSGSSGGASSGGGGGAKRK